MVPNPTSGGLPPDRSCRPYATARSPRRLGVPQNLVRRLDFTFYTDLVDATLKALGVCKAGRREVMKVNGKAFPRGVHGEMMPARGARFKVQRADERWENPDFVEAWQNLTTVHHNLVRFEGGGLP